VLRRPELTGEQVFPIAERDLLTYTPLRTEVSVRAHHYLALALVLSAIACGRSTPSSPDVATGAGAAITGSVLSGGGSPATAARVLSVTSAASGLSVSIAGTTLTSGVDTNGHFAFQDVPPGDRQLRFTGTGVDAALDITDIQQSETINLSVSLSGSSATIESQSRNFGSDRDIEGRVESLPPIAPASTFTVAGKTIETDGGTRFLLNGAPAAFADLVVGVRVHVKAHASGSAILATTVEIQNTNADIPVEVNGVIQSFSGVASNFQLTIDGRLLKGDAATTFFGNTVFADIKNGLEAEVKGAQRNGYVYITRLHVNTPDTGGSQDTSASIEGTLTSKSGVPPVLVVGGTIVTTTSATEVRRRGDVQDLSVLQIGMTLHVEGTRLNDGSIVARMVQIKDDQLGAPVEIEGSTGGLKGACPVVTFSINGFSIVTDGTTTFTPDCSTLKSGTKAKVKGTEQPAGTIKATSIEKS
jgi:uncharacterized protein DUF5666